jgi:hypothetical protein
MDCIERWANLCGMPFEIAGCSSTPGPPCAPASSAAPRSGATAGRPSAVKKLGLESPLRPVREPPKIRMSLFPPL